tara:strand:+ start:2596 stop:2835 length:240 start_codon:yes stop_codon:yes gene_type:complete
MHIALKKLKEEQLKDFSIQDLLDLSFYLKEDLSEVTKNDYKDYDEYERYEKKQIKIKTNLDLVYDLYARKLVEEKQNER